MIRVIDNGDGTWAADMPWGKGLVGSDNCPDPWMAAWWCLVARRQFR